MNRTVRQTSGIGRATRRDKGTSMLEVALVAPILMGILIGCIEIGWVFLVQHTMKQAAFAGARTLAFRSATHDEAQLEIQEDLDVLGYNFSVWMEEPEDGQRVAVHIGIPYQTVALAGNPLGILPYGNLEVVANLKKEGGG